MKKYIAYIKDNPERYWFKNKMYGIGWTPATKEGWFTIVLFVLWVVGVLYRAESRIISEDDVLQHIVAPVFFGVFVLLVITWKTGEPLRWTWKGTKTVSMHLHEDPFFKIQSGQKKVEVRVYDEKRRAIKAGDKINFISRRNPVQTLTKTVARVNVFQSFEELFSKYPSERTDIHQYYSKEDEQKYGVVAIELE